MVLVTMLIMPFKIAFFFWALYKAFTFKSWFKKFNEKAGGFASLSNADKAMFVVNVVFYAPYILKFLDKFSPRYVRFWHGLTQCMLIRRDSLNVTGTEKEHGLAYYFAASTACQLAGRVPFAIDSLNPLGVIGDNAVFDAGSAQVIVDQRTPEFKSGSNLDWSGRIRAGAAGNVDAGGSSRTARRGADPGAAQRVADASDVDVETAREALEMTGGDERRAGELLRTAAMGVPPSPPPPPPGRRMSPREAAAAAAAAAKADRMRVDQLSDDVRVVEEFSDASDDELARLIADLQNEMKNN